MKTIRFLMSLVLICSLTCIAEAAKVKLLIIPPDYDGGADLVNYHIEYREKNNPRWTKIICPAIKVEVNGKFEYAAVPCSVEVLDNATYIFRVSAENIYVLGRPGKSVAVEVKYDIDNIQVKCGKMPSIPSHRMFENGNICAIPEKGMMYRKEEDVV